MTKPDAMTEFVWAERADERRKTAARIAEQIAEIAPSSVGSVEEMQRLAVEAALAEGAPL